MTTFFFNLFSLIIPVLVRVALLTLMERKILAFSQTRKGPNKTLVEGLGQPFSDAIKLFLKEIVFPFKRNLALFKLGPILRLFLILIVWRFYPVDGAVLGVKYSSVALLIVLRFGVYPLIIRGWRSNSKYATLGALRGISQTISYELRLALIFFNFLILANTLTVKSIRRLVELESILIISPLLVVIWGVRCVAETNRTPFDFAEGESELVSGFNLEYAAGGFTLIFLAEYGMILFFRFFTRIFICGKPLSSLSTFYARMVMFIWIWTRRTLPRYRYDKLINLAWKAILPMILLATPCFLALTLARI